MESATVPYKISTSIATYAGDWTAQQIDAGAAGEPVIERHDQWYEPGPDGPVPVTDPARIAALDQQISTDKE